MRYPFVLVIDNLNSLHLASSKGPLIYMFDTTGDHC